MDKAENMQRSGNQESPAFRHGDCQTRGKYILLGQW